MEEVVLSAHQVLLRAWLERFGFIALWLGVAFLSSNLKPKSETEVGTRTLWGDILFRFLVLISLFIMFAFPSLILDTLGLLKLKENYLKIDNCLVINKGQLMISTLKQGGVYCDDGNKFVYRDTFDLSDRSREYKKGKIYEIQYLPVSKLIVSTSLSSNQIEVLIKRRNPNSLKYPFPETDEDFRQMEEILKRKLGNTGEAF
jgi:hypothetical protein